MAEIEFLRAVIRAAKVGLETADKWMVPNVGGWLLQNACREVEYALMRVREVWPDDPEDMKEVAKP